MASFWLKCFHHQIQPINTNHFLRFGYSFCLSADFGGNQFFLPFSFCSDLRLLQVVFKTRIYHCNVDPSGNVSLDILTENWSPALTISKVLLALRSMFTNPETCKHIFYLLSCVLSQKK